jgi:hypothetical protein
MVASNTYAFGTNTQIDDLIRESFERIGIIGDEFTGLQITSASMSANMELTSWTGKTPLSWMRKQLMISLNPGQPIYQLPINISNIIDVIATQPTRLNAGGTATSSAGGNAANCFDPTQTAGCIQTAANGNIAYDYGSGNSNAIQYVGVLPLNATSTYTLAVEYSLDGTNWLLAYQSPAQIYHDQITNWFVLPFAPAARAWRIRETAGATLSIQQIYFDVPTQIYTGDRTLTSFSYTEWMQLPSKMIPGIPSAYFFNNQIQPTITLWPVPNLTQPVQTYNNLLMTAYFYMQDVQALFQTFDIPQRFYEALVTGIAARLALKFAPDRYALLKSEAGDAFATAASKDGETVTLRFQPDFTYYGSSAS